MLVGFYFLYDFKTYYTPTDWLLWCLFLTVFGVKIRILHLQSRNWCRLRVKHYVPFSRLSRIRSCFFTLSWSRTWSNTYTAIGCKRRCWVRTMAALTPNIWLLSARWSTTYAARKALKENLSPFHFSLPPVSASLRSRAKYYLCFMVSYLGWRIEVGFARPGPNCSGSAESFDSLVCTSCSGNLRANNRYIYYY